MQTSIGQATPFGTGPFASTRTESTTAPGASTASTASSATVTANDFLELLVTEMKNQDPTANTDPNEYISQLVQVNSLEQLVQINQDLGSSASTNNGSSTGASVIRSAAVADAAEQMSADQAGAGSTQAGNLSQPGNSAAAARVADSLQLPSVTPTPANLQNFSRTPGSYTGAVRTNTSTAR